MKKNKSKSGIYIPIMVAILAFIFCWQYLVPRLKANKSSLGQVEAETSSLQARLESLKTAQSQLNALGDLVDQTLISVPEGVDMPNLLTELEAISVKHGTFLPSVQINDSKDDTSWSNVPISFGISSDYSSLIDFMKSIETSIRYMNIQSITLSGSDDKMSLGLQVEAFQRTQSVSGNNGTTDSVSNSE
jgi:Tfp pilus assembly protein PilO